MITEIFMSEEEEVHLTGKDFSLRQLMKAEIAVATR